MRPGSTAFAAILALLSGVADAQDPGPAIQVGPRPAFLVNDMADGDLKQDLLACLNGPFRRTSFSIGHRGAPLLFPEHTRESYEAAARMGAGVLECDVTFTKDKQLVCRHAQNDLHTTTNILLTPLASRCVKPFTPARLATDGTVIVPASAECRTSDLTLAEFKTLSGRMDTFNPAALTPGDYLRTPPLRADLNAGPAGPERGQLLSHRESIELFRSLGVMMTPELKAPAVPMPFDGWTQDRYAQKLIDEYRAAGVPAGRVWPQSFDRRDILYWIQREPTFGRQAVYLDDARTPAELPGLDELEAYKAQGINIVAPPLFALLALQDGEIVPSAYATHAKEAGLAIVTWSLERSGSLADPDNGFYYQTIDPAIQREGDVMRVIDVLARRVGVMRIFSDWPAAVTFYANCRGLK
jgi:glycerophosphoryl diester phosphodiesterase